MRNPIGQRCMTLVSPPAILFWRRPHAVLAVHQMAGILPDKARALYSIPDGYEPLTGIAIGYAGDPADLPEELRIRDGARRPRKPLKEFVFGGKWGVTATIL